MSSTAYVFAGLLYLFAGPTKAHGQEVEQLIEAGVDLREQGKDRAALAKFREAFVLSKSSQALAQIALAEQALGRWVDAEAHLREALSTKSNRWVNKRRPLLTRALASIQGRLARLSVEASVEGAEISVNGKSVGHHPMAAPVYVIAGSTVIEVSAEGYWSLSRKVELGGGARAKESFSLVPKPVEAAAPPSPAPQFSEAAPVVVAEPGPEPGPDLLPAGIVAAGGAAVAAGAGIAFLLVRNGHIDEYNDDSVCLAGGRTRDENCGASLDSANDAETVMVASFVGAGVLAATAVVLFLLDGGGGESAPSVAAVNSGPVMGCGAGPGDFGLGCMLKF